MYALKTELLGSGAPRPFLSSYAPKTELLGSGVPRPFRLPSLGKACVALMRIYGELGQIARLPKRPGFLINNGPSVVGPCFQNFVLPLVESESAHDGASGFGHLAWGLSGDRGPAFGVDGVGVVFFLSSSLVGVMLFPSYAH